MNLKRASLILLAAMFLPGLVSAQDIEITARFETFMNFYDDNPVATTVVHRECNTGLPLNQFFEMGDNDFVEFIATLLPAEEEIFYCSITAADVPNYIAWYSELGGDFELTPCDWTGLELDVLDWTVNCKIKMVPELAEVTVSKEWITTGAGGDAVDYYATVWASSPDADAILGSYHCPDVGFDDYYCLLLDFVGENPSDETFYVKTGFLGETILLRELNTDSSVETVNTCGGSVRVFPAGEASCGFVNTVFFEGIPTLSQYGLAIMALLMLGVGFVGFRRFV